MTILKDSLYILEEHTTTAGGAICRVRLNAADAVYKAHFPGHPVTPGAVIVQMAAELLDIVAGAELEISSIGSVKFLRELSPLSATAFTVAFTHLRRDGRSVSAHAAVSAEGVQYAVMSVVCVKKLKKDTCG